MIGLLRGWRHARLRRLLSTYVDGSASESERVRVEAHLSGCDACRVEADSLRATIDLLAALPEVVPSRSFALEQEPDPEQPVSRLVWTARVAAPAAALLLVALVVGNATGIIGDGEGLDLLGGMAADESIGEAPVEKIVTQEVMKEVPAEETIEVEKEVVRVVEVEKAVEVVREVEAPGEAVVVEMEEEAPVEVVVEREVEEKVMADDEAVVPEAMAESAESAQVTAAAPAPASAPELAGLPVLTATAFPRPTVLPTPSAVPTSTATSVPMVAAAVSEPTSAPVRLVSPEETPKAAPDRYDDSEGTRLPLWGIGVVVLLALLAALAGGFWAVRQGPGRR